MKKTHQLPLYLVLLPILLSACSGSSPQARDQPVEDPSGISSEQTTQAGDPESLDQQTGLESDSWDLVWISDSSGWGVAALYAQMIEEDMGVTVNVHDEWMGGLAAGAVYNALMGEPTSNFKLARLPSLIAEAEVVVLYGNPAQSENPDHPGDWQCVDDHTAYVNTCDLESFDVYIEQLTGIYARIFELRADHGTIVRAIDAYNAVIPRIEDLETLQACLECWGLYNTALRQAAAAYNVPVAAVWDAMNGPDHLGDPADMDYLRDSEHPNELGAMAIAEALRALGYEPTVP